MTTFIDFAEVKKTVPIAQVLQMLAIVTKQEGQKLRGPCPFCQDPRAFLVTPTAGNDGCGLWGCFKCSKRGDSIGLVAQVKGVKNNEAAALIQQHFGLGHSTVPSAGKSTVPRNSTLPSQSPQHQGGKPAFDPEAYASRLDTAHPSLEPLLLPETLVHFKAGYAKAGGNQGRLAIRVDDRQGNFLAYIGRALKDESPTIKVPTGFDVESAIFNAHRIQPGELYVVQDPLKVLAALEAGQENVVSFLTDGISALQWQMLASLMDERQCEKSYLF
jgi:hypothetical protein